MELFERLRREHEFRIGTIAGVAAKFGVLVRQAPSAREAIQGLMTKAAQIPDGLRAEFEECGEQVVAQTLARPLNRASTTLGVPQWAANEEERRLAELWLRQRRCVGWLKDGATFVLLLLGILVTAVVLHK